MAGQTGVWAGNLWSCHWSTWNLSLFGQDMDAVKTLHPDSSPAAPISSGMQWRLNKKMGLSSTAFEPTDNDIEKGGIAHKLSFTRVGRTTIAKKDS
jgi:hypothetical protein